MLANATDGPTRDAVTDTCCGEYESERAYAEELADELDLVPETDGRWGIDLVRSRSRPVQRRLGRRLPDGRVYVFRTY